ncbi:lytic transglycosylase domain-containing protein [Mesorhizobium sp. M0598]|uniref:lytic transglycosylase domain-containing protein n=1 Tax=Mesorhizobium sp. M0598 TaxID=2956968 RepID=UPI0033385F3E
MSKILTSDQQDTYWLAADFGRRFASTPSGRKSSLGEATFVDVFTAMIQRESNFKPRTGSSTGAISLGQLMPGTARDLGVNKPFSARQNLKGAATYLTEMLNEFGSVELALAAYNAGPGAVRKYGGIPPYRETRQYVSDVLHSVSVNPHNISSNCERGRRYATPRGADDASDDNTALEGIFRTVLRPSALAEGTTRLTSPVSGKKDLKKERALQARARLEKPPAQPGRFIKPLRIAKNNRNQRTASTGAR